MGRIVDRTWSRGLTTLAFVGLATGAVVIGCANSEPASAGGEHASVGDVRPDALDVKPVEPPMAVAAVDSGVPYEPVPPAVPARPSPIRALPVPHARTVFVTETPTAKAKPASAKLLAMAAVPAGGAHKGGATHVVRRGETLTAIAKVEYGDGRKWTRIAAANPAAATGFLKVGQTLLIP